MLRGYVGDKSAKPVFEGATPFDIVGEGYQRPFELATLRLFNMVGARAATRCGCAACCSAGALCCSWRAASALRATGRPAAPLQVGILPKWGELCPPNEQMLVQQGGTLVFEGADVVFRHRDSGILKYTDVDKLSQAVLAPAAAAEARPS